MGRIRDSLLWGIILLVVGLLFLLWNFNLFADYQNLFSLVVVGVFAVIGLAFLVSYLLNRQGWWKVIPGFTLLAVAGILLLIQQAAPIEWIAAVLFIGIALAFAVIYFSDRQANWWALIPFGSMLVMVTVILLATVGLDDAILGAILFGGMGLVFLLVYLLARERRLFRWALIPTSVLLVMGLVTLASALVSANPNLEQGVRLWPVLLVIIGVFLIGISVNRPKQAGVAELPAEPQPDEAPLAPGASVTEFSEEDLLPFPDPAAPSQVEPEQAAAGSVPAEADAAGEAGEVPDLYEFLRSAPPQEDDRPQP